MKYPDFAGSFLLPLSVTATVPTDLYSPSGEARIVASTNVFLPKMYLTYPPVYLPSPHLSLPRLATQQSLHPYGAHFAESGNMKPRVRRMLINRLVWEAQNLQLALPAAVVHKGLLEIYFPLCCRNVFLTKEFGSLVAPGDT